MSFSLSPILHNILWINTVNLSPTIDWSRRGINGLYCGNIHTEIFPGYTYKTFQNVTKRFKTSSLQKRLKRQVYKTSGFKTSVQESSESFLLINSDCGMAKKTKTEKKIQDSKHGCNRTCKFPQIQNMDVFCKRFWRVFVNLTY